MTVVTCKEMQAAESRLFATGVEAEGLMDEAGLGCALAIRQFFPRPARAVLYLGRGNNAGDALVVGIHLRRCGWEVSFEQSHSADEMSVLARKKLGEFTSTKESGNEPLGPCRTVLLDGLLGIGAKGPLRGRIADLAIECNRRRIAENGVCVAIDIPSGLNGDTGRAEGDNAIVAAMTLTICMAKAGLVSDEAINQVGRLVLIPLPILEAELDSIPASLRIEFPQRWQCLLEERYFDTHKGKAGRVAIIAGSRGLTGAARLASEGALRGGAGLVTLFAHESIYEILATTAPPEVMVQPTRDFSEVAEHGADVLAIGPGLGSAVSPVIKRLMLEDTRPVVIDADGLNELSRDPRTLSKLGENPRLLTPHPGEMRRLIGEGAEGNGARLEVAKAFSDHTQATVLYKGARTIVASPDTLPSINVTGHPGMATGGIGDVLTGLTASLIAQGYSLHDASALGSCAIGRAAEIGVFERGESAESLSAHQIADLLGPAFNSLRSRCF